MATTKAILIELRAALATTYEARLKQFPFKPAIRSAIIDGYKDGLLGMEMALLEMKVVELVDE